jgi:hypothetical protein
MGKRVENAYYYEKYTINWLKIATQPAALTPLLWNNTIYR